MVSGVERCRLVAVHGFGEKSCTITVLMRFMMDGNPCSKRFRSIQAWQVYYGNGLVLGGGK